MPYQAWEISTGGMTANPNLGRAPGQLWTRLLSHRLISGKRSRIISVLNDHPGVDQSEVMRHSTAQLL
jgi:hypothetical protein